MIDSCFQASLFLAGPALAKRSFVLDVGNGKLPVLQVALQGVVAQTRRVICADGGLTGQPLLKETRLNTGDVALASFPKVVWIGDGDSISSALTQKSERAGELSKLFGVKESEVVEELLPVDKDRSDGALAFENCVSALGSRPKEDIQVIEVVGGLGGRSDHERANVLEMAHVFFKASDPVQPRVVVVHAPRNFRPSGETSMAVLLTNTPVVIKSVRKGSALSLFQSFMPGNSSVENVAPSLEFELTGAEYSGRLALRHPSQGLSNHALGGELALDPHGQLIEMHIEVEA